MKKLSILLIVVSALLLIRCNPIIIISDEVTVNYHLNIDANVTAQIVITNTTNSLTYLITTTVGLTSNSITPSLITVPHGSYVKWVNNDSVAVLGVVEENNVFFSVGLDPGKHTSWQMNITNYQ